MSARNCRAGGNEEMRRGAGAGVVAEEGGRGEKREGEEQDWTEWSGAEEGRVGLGAGKGETELEWGRAGVGELDRARLKGQFWQWCWL